LTPNAPTGQQHPAQGSALWEGMTANYALQGQKLLHLQRVLTCMHDTQGDALGYEQVGLTDRSLSEWVYFYVVAKKEQKNTQRLGNMRKNV